MKHKNLQLLIIKQLGMQGFESRAATILGANGKVQVDQVDYEHLDLARNELLRGNTLVLGSVEFVRKAMAVASIKEPANISYPAELWAYLGRKIRLSQAGCIEGRVFVKPTKTKIFTGFIYTPGQEGSLDEHDAEQARVLKSLDPSEPVWVSDPIEIATEVRYYIHNGAIVGAGRYDQLESEDLPLPDPSVIEEMIASYGTAAPVAYAIDAGLTTAGETILIECNDAWALGLYRQGAYKVELDNPGYFQMLADRWQEIKRSTQSD